MPDAPKSNKPSSAVALAYHAGDAAPKVVAKGKGLIAEQIIRKAEEAGVVVHESRELVSILMGVDLDKEIPPLLYRVVAELLAWLYYLESAQKDGTPLPEPPEVIIPSEQQQTGTAVEVER